MAGESKRKIATEVALDGEHTVKQAISSLNKEISVLGSELKKVAAEFEGQEKSIEGLTAKNDVLSRQTQTQKDKINELKSALAQCNTETDEGKRAAQGYQIQLNNAETALIKTEREIKANDKAIEDLKNETDKTGEEMEETSKSSDKMASSIDDAGDSADKSGKKFDGFGGVLAGVGVALGAVGAAAGAAAIKLGKEVVQQFGELEQNLGGSEAVFGKYAASIQKTGEEAYKNLGVSQSDYLATANKMGALFQGSGVEQQKSLQLTEQAMQRAADMASVMGIDMQSALDSVAGAAKGNFTMMDNLGVAMNATTIEAYAAGKGLDFVWSTASQAEKSEMAMQMFFENTEQYAGNFAKESTETISGSLGLLDAAVGSFTAGLGNADADMQNLTANVVDAFSSVVDNIVPVLENIVVALPAALDAIIPAIGKLLPTLLKTATDLFKKVLDAIMKLLPELIPAAVEAILTIAEALIDSLPLLIDAAMQIILALANGLVDSLPTLIPKIVEVVMQIVSTLVDNLPLLIDAAIQIIVALAEGLINALPSLLEKVPEIINSLIDGLLDNLDTLIDAAIDIVLALVEGIINNLPMLIEAGIKIMMKLSTALVGAIPELIMAVPKLWKALFKALIETDWLQVGIDILGGIAEGLIAGVTEIGGTIKKVAGKLVDGFKGFFGIHSPSTVFRDSIGVFLAQGLGEGFKEEMDKISEDMQDAVPTEFGGINADIHAAGAAISSTGAPGAIYLHIDNFYNNNDDDIEELGERLQMSAFRRSYAGGM